ncbi:MAG: AraC family transcriptional regulator [Verrucomicrobiota bacterium]|nr:AraC family transcriptional regulator [Verrucomicrobiota bacterium]
MEFHQFNPDFLDLKLLMEMPREVRGLFRNHVHSHDFFELGLIIKGECDCEYGQSSLITLKEGQGLLVPPGQEHVESNRKQGLHQLGWVGFSVGSPEWSDYLTGSLCQRVLSMEGDFDEILRVFRALQKEQGGRNLHGPARIRLLLIELLILMDRSQSKGSPTKKIKAVQTNRHSRVLASAADYLELNYGNPMSITQIARYHSLSMNHFIVLFTKEYKVTPKHYLQQIRLRKALGMIRDEKRQIKEIGILCGFKDPARFCRWIKAETGKSPRQYRKDE